MPGACDDEERTLADLRFGSGSPATWYLGLSTTVPNDDGSNFTEPTIGSLAYARVAITNNATNWPAASTSAGNTTKANGAAFTFPNPTGYWGNAPIVGYGFFLASSGGTPRYVYEMESPVMAKSGYSPVQFDIGAIVHGWD